MGRGPGIALAEQHRIVAKGDELMALCDQREASHAATTETRHRLLDTLLHEALTPSKEETRQDISTVAQELPAKLYGAPKALTTANVGRYITRMSLPDINFENIRPVDGSRHAGFEEMCCQLASMEPEASGENCHRKGHGGDAGVECYRRRADGTEVGWQAKYLFHWSNSLKTQLDRSIRTALNKHPQLVEYVVCLPFDLSDSRTRKGKTAREKWDAWCAKWKKFAAEQKRDLTITLWGRSGLSTRLAREDPAYSGLLLYWFSRETLTAAWFKEQFGKARDSLGSRYIAETNVELPIRQDFLAFARHRDLQKQIDEWFLSLTDKGRWAVREIRGTGVEAAETHSDSLAVAVDALASLLAGDPIELDQPYPVADWIVAASDCLDLARKALRWSYDLPPSKPNSMGIRPNERGAQHALHELMEVLHEIKRALASNRWQLTNKKAVLLQGPAGIGKSHLLADIVEHHLHEGGPALLLLGGDFIDSEPWPQIRDKFDLPPTEQFKHFLGSLDAAAQAAGTRALVCIDALNERNGIDVWPQRLAAFLKAFEAFPRVGVILSCRSTYVPYVIPDDLDEDRLFCVEHRGFAATGGQAAKFYLDRRGMVRPGAPDLVPEFENPLFLKTCCDSLRKEGKTEFPRGLRGVTSIFKFYNKAVTRSLNRRMQLDAYQEIVPKAIASFSQLLVDTGNGYALKHEAITLFESVLASGGSLEKSLLTQLESEGLLTVEPLRQDDGSLAEMVRFTFERFSDHAIASRLLDDHVDTHDVAGSFQAGHPLHEYVSGPVSYERVGIIEAMAIQLPERTGVEILDVGSEVSYPVRNAFLHSLLWREQSRFTGRTFELCRGLVDTDELSDLLVSISTEPSNEFNALFVHKKLMKMTMPERDACWSIYLADRGIEGPVKTLISWALQNDLKHMDKDRAYLAATMLTWFFTTSHREIRDKATKALASVLSRRLVLAARLLGDFVSVNDPYVLERLLAACYGAALQGTEETGLGELAQVVFDKIFADGKPPANALLRDHARGIVEYAAWRGVLDSSIDLTLARPPYQSLWPIEPVPDELIKSYTEDRGRGAFRDAIVSSTVSDMGDFATYVIDYKVNRWSPARIGTIPLPTSLDIYEAWKEEFPANATADQRQAFNEYVSAAEGVKKIHGYQSALEAEHNSEVLLFEINEISEDTHDDHSTPETARLDAAEVALEQTMTPDQWEDFRVRAKDFPRREAFTDQAVHFDAHWGRRWICKRAHELGWTSERFGNFDDRSRSYDRHNHRVERIGKKYQWLALHELIARMADNLAFLDSPQQEDNDEPVRDWAAREVGLRNIDPSLLTTQTHYDGWREWDRTWWVPFDPQFRVMVPYERLAWLESDSDIINESALIDLRNPKTGRRWLALSGSSNWRGNGVRGGEKELQRDTWFRLTCIVIRRKDLTKMIESLRDEILTHPSSFPDIELHSEYFYLGEYPWHPEMREFDRWTSHNGQQAFAVPIRPTVSSYVCSGGSYDCSVDKTISVKMPAPWLSKEMGLRLSSGRSLVFVNSDGRETFYDPSVVEPGPAAALVDREAFLRVLDQQDLSAIWVIAGEKNAFGGRDAGLGFGGRLLHTALYHLDGDDFIRYFYTDRIHPTESQLQKFFGEDPVPSGIMTKTAGTQG